MKARTMWTALITALFALLAAVGLSTAATAAQQPATTSAPTTTEAVSATAPWSQTHEQSAPPTMTQRIRAEAHGASPSSRHLPRELGDVMRPDLGQTAATTLTTRLEL